MGAHKGRSFYIDLQTCGRNNITQRFYANITINFPCEPALRPFVIETFTAEHAAVLTLLFTKQAAPKHELDSYVALKQWEKF